MKSHSRFKTPAVSVIVPVYNTAPYLRKCLDSLLNQTLTDMEIIVVDDGSTDGSDKIIDDYAKRFKRIVAIHKKNGGVASVYNVALRRARGKYIGIIDSDDWTNNKMFETLYEKAKETSANVVKSFAYWPERERKHKGKHTKRIAIPLNKCNRLIKDPLEISELIQGHPCHWTAIYNHRFLSKIKLKLTEKPKESAADIEFIYKVWLNLKSVYVVPKAFVHYRLDRPNAERNSNAKMSFRLINVHEIVRDYFLKEKADKTFWYIKTHSEFCHLKFELQQRCLTRRKEFIGELSKLFWANLEEDHFVTDFFSWKDLFLYHVIACFPFLYYLNDLTRFWITRPAIGGYVAKWRLFGLWRTERPGRLVPKKSKQTKYYILGVRVH
ncbi:MAG: glycosyltransferase [Alphaproteobacteria bacterium]|nr:glycosyltransferase [Alphaproteobacteria bacterium]